MKGASSRDDKHGQIRSAGRNGLCDIRTLEAAKWAFGRLAHKKFFMGC